MWTLMSVSAKALHVQCVNKKNLLSKQQLRKRDYGWTDVADCYYYLFIYCAQSNKKHIQTNTQTRYTATIY